MALFVILAVVAVLLVVRHRRRNGADNSAAPLVARNMPGRPRWERRPRRRWEK